MVTVVYNVVSLIVTAFLAECRCPPTADICHSILDVISGMHHSQSIHILCFIYERQCRRFPAYRGYMGPQPTEVSNLRLCHA